MYRYFGVSPMDTLAKLHDLAQVDMIAGIKEALQGFRKALDQFEDELKVEKEDRNAWKGSMLDKPRGWKILA